jgi:hypothetical protein
MNVVPKHVFAAARERDQEVLAEKRLAAIRRILEAHGRAAGYDPLEQLALLATDESTTTRYAADGTPYEAPLVSVEMKGRLHEVVAGFIYPKLKMMEISGPNGGPIETKSAAIEQILALMEAAVRKRGDDK